MDLPTWIIYGLKVNEGEVQFELTREDYLKLWMYFEDRADKVKEAMFKTITWTIGYAAALQGFIFLTLSATMRARTLCSSPPIQN